MGGGFWGAIYSGVRCETLHVKSLGNTSAFKYPTCFKIRINSRNAYGGQVKMKFPVMPAFTTTLLKCVALNYLATLFLRLLINFLLKYFLKNCLHLSASNKNIFIIPF